MERSKKPKEEGVEIPVRVEDRRFWARQSADPAEGAEAAPFHGRKPTYVEELEAALAEARQRTEETLAAHRRRQAEFDEIRARLSRDVDARVNRAKAELFRKLLGVADDMDRALEAAGRGGEGEALAAGVERIRRQLAAVLADEGVEQIDVLDLPFDPETAEAIGVVPVEADRHDLVVQELRPGYRLGDLTLRPAQVQVGRAR